MSSPCQVTYYAFPYFLTCMYINLQSGVFILNVAKVSDKQVDILIPVSKMLRLLGLH